MSQEEIMDEKILVTNIQRFSLHEGPGIRTQCFLKGCSLRCPWCSNPENVRGQPEPYIKDGVKGTYGKYISLDDLYTELIKDRLFYGESKNFCINSAADMRKLPGGVTFSGGECLLQMEQLEPLLIRLRDNHIHMIIESCLFASSKQLSIAISYIDFFYVDIKIMDGQRCRDVLCGDISTYLLNLDMLLASGKPVVFRIPVIGGYTDDNDNQIEVVRLIKRYGNSKNIIKIELMKEHCLGMEKWKSLKACDDKRSNNETYQLPDYKGVSEDIMQQYYDKLAETGIPVEICRV